VAPGTDGLWKKPPFASVVEDRIVWGRGTLDNKSNLIAQRVAVEMLVKPGFKPRCTLYLVFGHDEAVGGGDSAVKIVALLKRRGVQLDFVLAQLADMVRIDHRLVSQAAR